MNFLGKTAAVATIIAAGFTVAAYFDPKPSSTKEWQELVNQLPEIPKPPIAEISPKINDEALEEAKSQDVIKSVVIDSPEALKNLHEIAKKISYSPTRNSELKKLVKISMQKGHVEYATLIANDISYSPTRNDALKIISTRLLEDGEIQAALKAAELISYSPTRNEMLQTILKRVAENEPNKSLQQTAKAAAE
ncbi:hypothetical protein [Marinomonas posidonica]|uniref:hypothetical protein n=1 Tax=Marinomonas posidonica TaxID=936476 RepID=UPI003735B370